MFKRIALFLATNLAVLALLSIVMAVLRRATRSSTAACW